VDILEANLKDWFNASEQDARMLQRLGAAALAKWSTLPAIAQEAIISTAGLMSDPKHHQISLVQDVRAFIEKHR
jgi:hypothetical protein